MIKIPPNLKILHHSVRPWLIFVFCTQRTPFEDMMNCHWSWCATDDSIGDDPAGLVPYWMSDSLLLPWPNNSRPGPLNFDLQPRNVASKDCWCE
jgi:hypothetical protein